MSKFHVVLFSLLFGFFSVFSLIKAQNVQPILNLADSYRIKKDYFGANFYLEQALKIDSTNSKVLYAMGTNLMDLNNYELAIRYLKKASLFDQKNELPLTDYYLAEAYRNSGEYRKSRRYYTLALKPYRRNKNEFWYQRINTSKLAATWAYKNKDQTTKSPFNLSTTVNTSYSEYGAVFYENYLLYAAMIPDSGIGHQQILDEKFYSRIYYKDLNSDGTLGQITIKDKDYNKIENFHHANPMIFGNTLYFSVCDTNYQCAIYRGDFKQFELSKIKKLNDKINFPSTTNTQPQLVVFNSDTVLYFVSDREGGMGGYDIWKSILKNRIFTEPIPLSDRINTMGNEITPYFDVEGEALYFSSDWHLNYGGFDIFKSALTSNLFQKPENIGKGINSYNNEYYFKPQEKQALFSSNRQTGNVDNSANCCNDIFQVEYIRKIEEKIDEDTVSEAILNKYLPLSLFFHNDYPNPNSQDTLTAKNFMDLAIDYLKLKNEYLEKYPPSLNEEEQDFAELELENFFDREVEAGLDQLISFTPKLLQELEKGSEVVLTIRGFASALSNSQYNKKLTLRRIQSLINYFKVAENGKLAPYISSGKLSFKKMPFGDLAVSSSINPNDKIAAIYSAQAAQERKIELIGLSSTAANSILNTESGAQIVVDSNSYVFEKTEKNGVVVISNKGKSLLTIYNVTTNNEKIELMYNKQVEAGSKSNLVIHYANVEPETTSIEIMIVSNAINNNLLKIKISLK